MEVRASLPPSRDAASPGKNAFLQPHGYAMIPICSLRPIAQDLLQRLVAAKAKIFRPPPRARCVALDPAKPRKSSVFRGRHFSPICRLCRPRRHSLPRAGRFAFRLAFRRLCAYLRPRSIGPRPGSSARFKARPGFAGGFSALPRLFRPRPAVVSKGRLRRHPAARAVRPFKTGGSNRLAGKSMSPRRRG